MTACDCCGEDWEDRRLRWAEGGARVLCPRCSGQGVRESEGYMASYRGHLRPAFGETPDGLLDRWAWERGWRRHRESIKK